MTAIPSASAADYARLLLQLLPEGPIWPETLDSDLGRLLLGKGAEYARIHNRVLKLGDELDPRTMYETLSVWERYAGLPDPCAGEEQSLEGRRRRLHMALTARGGASPGYFIAIAATLGFYTEIDQPQPMRAGRHRCGARLYHRDAVYTWSARAPLTTYRAMRVGHGCNERLRYWGNADLECTIRARAPAHHEVYFHYVDVNDNGGIAPLHDGLIYGGPITETPDEVIELGSMAA